MEILQCQVQTEGLRRAIKSQASANARENPDTDIVSMLRSVPEGYSLASLSYDIFQFLKKLAEGKGPGIENFDALIGILISRFEMSFRPSARDVMGVLVTLSANNQFSMVPAGMKLLNYALGNQQGNPKITFSCVASEFLPWLCSSLPLEVVIQHEQLIAQVLHHLFASPANRQCLVAYLKSVPEPSLDITGGSKKRKSDGRGDVYVSVLFETLAKCSHICVLKLILREFVVSEDAVANFLFFKSVIAVVPSLELRIALWREMAELRVYQLRGDASEEHRSELMKLFESAKKSPFVWGLIRTVIEIDPINFGEIATRTCFELLADDSRKDVSSDLESCLKSVFKMHANKGLFSRLVEGFLNSSAGASTPRFPMSAVISSVAIAPQDLMDSYKLLFEKLEELNPFAVAFLTALIPCGRLTENFNPAASELFQKALETIITQQESIGKKSRLEIAHLVIVLVDGLRKIYFAYLLPTSSVGAMSSIEVALNWAAKKCAPFRCDALLRLAGLCQVALSMDDIRACPEWEQTMASFYACNDFVNRMAIHHITKEGSLGCTTKNTDEESLPAFIDHDIPSLVAHARSLSDLWEAMACPPILRGSEFPKRILQLEAAISNTAAAVVGWEEIDPSDPVHVYLFTVALEEIRRGSLKTKVGTVVAKKIMERFYELDTVPLAMMARFGAVTRQKELLMHVAGELLSGHHIRDLNTVNSAYYALFQAMSFGRDKRKVRAPWWTCQMFHVTACLRGLIGCCLTGVSEQVQITSAHHVVRIWKLVIDSFSSERFFKISKSVVILVTEYMRFGSGRITNGECVSVLDAGASLLLGRLTKEERQHCASLLNSTERESLKRIHELYEKKFKFTGKV